MNYQDPGTIAQILQNSSTIAVVGLSTDPKKPSAEVAAYLQRAGYRIVPVHPTADILLGERAYPTLRDIPHDVDLVDVFRPAAEAMELVEQAIAIGARYFWLQSGIVSLPAAERASAAGLAVVMDRCTMVEHRRCLAEGILFPASS